MKAEFLALVIVFSLFLNGCNVFLPKHENSLDTKGEKVRINMLTASEIKSKYMNEYLASFGDVSSCTKPYFIEEKKVEMAPPAGERLFFTPFLGTAVAAASGFAIDMIKSGIQKDAEKYEAQFGNKLIVDDYYALAENVEYIARNGEAKKGIAYTNNYCGFEIVRESNAHHGEYPAFKAVFGISGTNNAFLYKIAPLYFKTTSTKAKVLKTEWYSYLIPPFFWPLLLNDGDEIKTTIDIELTSYWLDSDRNSYNTEKVAAISYENGNYNITNSPEIKANHKNTIGIFYVAPEFKTDEKSSGIMELKVLVTEKDPSNAKAQIEKLGELVGKQKDKVVEYVGKSFKNNSTATK